MGWLAPWIPILEITTMPKVSKDKDMFKKVGPGSYVVEVPVEAEAPQEDSTKEKVTQERVDTVTRALVLLLDARKLMKEVQDRDPPKRKQFDAVAMLDEVRKVFGNRWGKHPKPTYEQRVDKR